MTLPLFLVDPALVASAAPGGAVLLDGPEGRHAATVRRITVGERVLLSDGAGRRLVCEVAGAGRAELDLRVLEVEQVPEPRPRFVLVQALAKGDRDDQAVEAATECGVDEVVPWQAARCIVQWRGERGEKARGKWVATVVAAAKQSRRARVPVVAELATTKALAARVAGAAAAYVLHEDATTSLASQALPDEGDVVVVVGPEGGITPEEVAALEAAGAVAVRLGDTVLRSSSAGPAALAVLSAAGRWR
ncbi:16S rRNA (uracil(1498)-N(3))-methyltransferase [Phycicoccus sp. M110.8]|uniref:16S rRNA (uracil(1498)-N(3))-methyltransferase n=1 Tax=Phycicoccus sp. M110.8 TaxID=3075433 RepID=UPI0028FD1DF5|nr:16S rRNA (uracil(1498)-N(3))-methyltransferase [Phycicoccus sp. M110.8]MDU0312199.1 16S rRNA (uracil(1498)-N(3))-methyltransferase [Phycicoccus sp. M110.8]HET8768549.1 16S rRNA (uracil(1498)-N(3))-methyltransferase [Pedococcus sp.]